MTTTSMRNSPANGTPGTSTPQGRMGRMGAMPPTNATMNGTVLKPLSSLKAQKLEMAAVERRGQPNMAREFSKPQRLFGLSEAPTFNPTEEQFKNPIEYIKSIADEGRRFGIVKIIPPDSWNPDLAIDTERFHFRTRRQELNIVEGGTRANLNYLDQLAKFHKQRNGTNLNRFPSVDKRPLDLYKLKNLVEAQGGFERVCKGKKWAEIGRLLGYSGKIMSSLSTSLKNSYQKWLLPFEDYLAQVKPGVRQQQELENGGPYTPSPSRSPLKIHQHTPSSLGGETSPAMRASGALNASMQGTPPQMATLAPEPPVQIPQPPPLAPAAPPVEPPRPSSGFTAVNFGFTAVNSGFTAVNAAPPSLGFAAINATNGVHKTESNHATPQRSFESPQLSALNTPNLAPSAISHSPLPIVQAFNPMKRPLSMEDDDGVNGDSEAGRRSKRLKKDGAPTVAGSHMTQPRLAAPRSLPPRGPNEKPGTRCENCGGPGDAYSLAICDGCEFGYHPHCLDPPLPTSPVNDWFCPRCLVGNGDFGFEEGGTYSLKQFQQRAQNFKDAHFATKMVYDPIMNTRRPVTEEEVEREFWRLTESLTETVEVEYGADIHSHISGSGFPTLEKNPRDPYASDPWNLNNLPLDKDSLFRHIKTDISGMTVPWLYVGMCFSCFCWHAEDHNTYSANYQHFGATKTWYGVPAEDAEKLENAMRDLVPELFESNPDLLFQLTTLFTPDRLRKAGVRVYALDQRAGQFVITFPQAYHAGFNHGFNFNEAVNFAPQDWEPYGEEAVRRLRMFRRQPVFCHDELLLSAASRDHSIKTARWLGPAFERMEEEELRVRNEFVKAHRATREHSCPLDDPPAANPQCDLAVQDYPEEISDDDCVCAFCKSYSYLSRYVCKKMDKVVCLEHAGHYECCDMSQEERFSASGGHHVLQFRMTSEEMRVTVQRVLDTARTPEAWTDKLDSLLEEYEHPPLKNFRTILGDGEKINQQWELKELPDLRKFVDRCLEWVEEATNYTTRKQQNRRKNERAWRKQSMAKAAEQEERDKELRNVDNIKRLLRSAEDMGFDCPEISLLREKSENIESFQQEANQIMSHPNSKSTTELEEFVELGRSFNVDIPEVDQLEKLLKQMQWYEQCRERQTPGKLGTLQDISDFIQQGLDMDIPETDSFIIHFREKRNLGEFWENKAKEIMEAENVHHQQLDALSTQAADLPVSRETLAKVDAILKKQRDAQERIVALYESSKNPDLRQRPTYKEVKDAMEALTELTGRPPGTLDLEREQKRHEDWMRRGKKLFGKANAPLHILLQHMQWVEARNESCFDLRDTPRMPVEPSSRANSPTEHDDIDVSDPNRDVFCICRKPEAGMMIECEICHEWYHGKCLKIARGKIKEDDKYTCPICDYRVKIPRDAARPKLEDLQAWQDELSGLPFQPDEEECLNNIVDQATSFRNHITHLMNPMMSTPDELSVQRFYLRKIEGADVLLTDETNFLRQELHRWAPVAPEPPPKLEHSLSTRKPRPTKQQKMMKEMGLTNPDDLPVHLRTKKVARKNSDAPAKDGKPAVPGQAAAAENSRSHTPPGDPPAFRVGNPPAQGASVPGSRRESAVEGFGYATGGRFNDDDNNMFASASSSNLAGPTGGFMQSSTSPTETSPAIDPALFDPGSTSPTLQQTGHKRNISDAGPAPSFSGLGEGSQEEPGYFASMAGEALGLTSAVDGEFGNASVEGDTESKGKVEDGIDEFLA